MADLAALSAASWTAELAAAGVEGGVGEALGRFLATLGRWSRSVDLCGRRDVPAVIGDVVAALAGVRFLPTSGALLDIGSGNGVPAVPLLVARAGLTGVLLEPRERRWAFLAEVVRELGLVATVRRERAVAHGGGPYQVVSVRGVSAGEWEGELARLVGREGVVLWWTGRREARRAARWPRGRVLTSVETPSGEGVLVVWRRCFT